LQPRRAEHRLGRHLRRRRLPGSLDGRGQWPRRHRRQRRRYGRLGHERRRHGRLGHEHRRRYGRLGDELRRSKLRTRDLAAFMSAGSTDTTRWTAQPAAAKRYVIVVIAAGATALGTALPFAFARPPWFLALLAASCVTSSWKVNLPIPLGS